MLARDQDSFDRQLEHDRNKLIDRMLDAGRMVYFDMIEELIRTFLNAGIDLAYEGHSLNSFIRLVRRCYLSRLPRVEREKEGLWSKIWWFQRLQDILEDERNSVSQALINGWHWFVNPEQWPTKSSNRKEYTDMWLSLSQERRDQFLDDFSLSEDKLMACISKLSTQDFCCENALGEEGVGMKRELRAAGIPITDYLNVPRLAEEALRDGSACSICGEGYGMESTGTEQSHAPVRVTPCGHVFGWRCLMARLNSARSRENGNCTECGVRFCACVEPRDLLSGCGEILRWLNPPMELKNTTGPHSFTNKLMLVFEPADEVRKRLKYWQPHGADIGRERAQLRDLGVYLAYERMTAVSERNITGYREAVLKQTYAIAQRLWIEFLDGVLPHAW